MKEEGLAPSPPKLNPALLSEYGNKIYALLSDHGITEYNVHVGHTDIDMIRVRTKLPWLRYLRGVRIVVSEWTK